METTTFKPVQIGRPNNELKNRTIKAYENLIDCACDLQLQIGACLEDPTDQPIDFFINAIKEEIDPFIKNTFVRINEIKIKGISIDKMMELELLAIPELQEARNSRKRFDQALQQVKETKFFYPLRKLYVNDEIGWNLTPEFYKELDYFVRIFTTSQEQNEMLKVLNQMVDSFNGLVKLKVLRPNRGQNELTNLFQFLSVDISSKEPYSVSTDTFKRGKISRFNPTTTNINNRLSYNDMLN